MPDQFWIWLTIGVWTVVLSLSNFVAGELRGERTSRADGLMPADGPIPASLTAGPITSLWATILGATVRHRPGVTGTAIRSDAGPVPALSALQPAASA